jgi:eukaryotic-like serine/threonine-protein kinase
LKPDERAAVVMARVKELNPGFDGQHTAKVAEGEVRSLEFITDNVSDISPLAALPYLWDLSASASADRKGKLTNLAPLAGHWELAAIHLKGNPVADLSTLTGKPLVTALLNDSNVRDLTPLKGGTVRVLHLNGCPIRDLTPLKGMKLTELACLPDDGKEIDLSPVADAPLDRVWCAEPTGENAAILRAMRSLRIVNDKPAEGYLQGK